MNKYLALVLLTSLTACGSLNIFSAKESAPVSQVQEAAMRSDICPQIETREGAAIYKLTSGKGDSPLEVRYVASFTELQRECSIEGQTMRIKIGLEGKVVLGPQGSAGTLTLPIRMALVKGVSDNPIATKFYQLPVGIPANAANVFFSHIDGEIVIPLPPPEDVVDMTIYIGFDSKGATTPKKKK
jgi:hypothetical protein